MQSRNIRIVDPVGNVVATGEVMQCDDLYMGSVNLSALPSPSRVVFEQYEEIVEGQVLSLLDQAEAKIADLHLAVVFDEGTPLPIVDLQLLPHNESISFRTASLLPRASDVQIRNGAVNVPTFNREPTA